MSPSLQPGRLRQIQARALAPALTDCWRAGRGAAPLAALTGALTPSRSRPLLPHQASSSPPARRPPRSRGGPLGTLSSRLWLPARFADRAAGARNGRRSTHVRRQCVRLPALSFKRGVKPAPNPPGRRWCCLSCWRACRRSSPPSATPSSPCASPSAAGAPAHARARAAHSLPCASTLLPPVEERRAPPQPVQLLPGACPWRLRPA
jgi:hypothetical protein